MNCMSSQPKCASGRKRTLTRPCTCTQTPAMGPDRWPAWWRGGWNVLAKKSLIDGACKVPHDPLGCQHDRWRERADARHHLGRQQEPDLQGRARKRLSAIKEAPATGP